MISVAVCVGGVKECHATVQKAPHYASTRTNGQGEDRECANMFILDRVCRRIQYTLSRLIFVNNPDTENE